MPSFAIPISPSLKPCCTGLKAAGVTLRERSGEHTCIVSVMTDAWLFSAVIANLCPQLLFPSNAAAVEELFRKIDRVSADYPTQR